MEPTRLYLDTAKIGRMAPGAKRTHDDFARLAADEGGSPFFDHFLRHGTADWSAATADRYPGLAAWQGVGGLKERLRRLTGTPANLPVLLAHRSAQLMTLAARLIFGPCRGVLVTDVGWPGWHAVLHETARRADRWVTEAAVRDGVLRHDWDEDDVVRAIREAYRRSGCDGVFLSGVSNLGVRLPVARIVRELSAIRELQFVAADGSQELNHLPADLDGEHCDLYLAGCHKWLGASHPLAVAVYGRRRSRHQIDTRLSVLTTEGVIDDPLLRMTAQLESGHLNPTGETVSLMPLFTAHGATEDAVAVVPAVAADPSMVAALAADAGWTPLLTQPALRSSILLLQSDRANVRESSPIRVRDHFGRHGVALTAYLDGVIRLSLPCDGLGEEGTSLLRTSLESACSI